MQKKIVIVGCGAAGWSAAVGARKTDRKAQIIVVEQGEHPVYERGGIPYVIQGDIPTFEALVNFPPQYYDFMKIGMYTRTKATNIDSSRKEVTAYSPLVADSTDPLSVVAEILSRKLI